MAPRAGRQQLRLFGFPVRIGYGFVIFMILLAIVPRAGNQRFGVYLAAAVAIFTLIHELGHAFAARHVGAEAGISLEFMAGYTSYRATRPISRPWTVVISLAGPFVQIAVSLVVLVAMGINPLARSSIVSSDLAQAIWWAGPVIGLLNLIPVLPLDGGNVVATILDGIAPGKGRRAMIYVSLILVAAALVSTAFFETTRQFTIFIGFLLIMQLSQVFEDRNRHAVSPFDAAAQAMRNGQADRAVRLLTRGLQRPSPQQIVPRELSVTPDDALARAIAALPRPLPSGNPWNEYLLATLMVRSGDAREAADYAAARYAENPSALPATAVARAAATLGDAPTAAGWLRAARNQGLDDEQLRRLVLAAPEFASVRASQEVQAVIGTTGWAPPTVGRIG